MTRLEFLILSILQSKNAINRFSALTVKEIASTEDFGYKSITFYKHIINLKSKGLISDGAKDGKAYTFFINQSGIKRLKEERDVR